MKTKVITILLMLMCMFGFCAEKNDKIGNLKVMSFNIRYDEPKDAENNWIYRRQACVNMIIEQQPDVFGIQEGLIHQVNFMDSALTKYTFVGVGRDSLTKNNEYAAIFFRTDKFDLLRSETFWLSETPGVSSKGWDAKYNRIATWVHLRNKENKKEFFLLNTHFDHIGTQSRIESAKLITAKIIELSGGRRMVFLTGDFNSLPDDELFEPLNAYLQSSQKVAKDTDSHGTTNAFRVLHEGKIIDYIFYMNATTLKYQTIVKNYGVPYISDHYPIVATFEY